ncbi:MAG: hypothetical protein JOZ73_05060 [Solirubrobacterales bacterium]|nr:hypothetical protein [Solirubrobacterales bacterium]
MVVTDELRYSCAEVARRARYVRVNEEVVAAYARNLQLNNPAAPDDEVHLLEGPRELLAAFWVTLDAVNFGSGWFPTLRKRQGRSGYVTIASGIRDRFTRQGPWSASELAQIEAREIAAALGQEPDHELMALFASSLRDLGGNLEAGYGSSFTSLLDSAEGSAVALATTLAAWESFADTSGYDELEIPFLKRAQILAADVARAGVGRFDDLGALTMFADNLVPHVLRIDRVLTFAPELKSRVENRKLLEHNSREEIEIRACAVNAVEQIIAARPQTNAMDVDAILWRRGQEPRYKASPRHRSRCTAY